MSIFDPIVQAFEQNRLVVLIPIFAGLVGWITNVAAVWLLFHPVEFRGIRPFLGWQGVIPGAADRMTAYLAELVSGKLLDMRALFAELDAAQMLPTVRPALDRMADDLLDEAVRGKMAPMWNALDENARTQIRTAVRGEVEKLAEKTFADIRQSAEDIIDVAETIRAAVAKDRALLNNLFQVAGSGEFKFVRISGLYFGTLFGIPQFLIWCYYPATWLLPVGGLLVGYVTNWLAMKMIFEPKEPMKLGPMTIQGLFHKRQEEVAIGFSDAVATTMLTPANVLAQVESGGGRETLRNIFRARINETIERYKQHPMAAGVLQQVDPAEIDTLVVRQVEMRLTEKGGLLWHIVERTLDVASTMQEKLKQLDPHSFEGVLRPAFQQDEWKLIAVGAVLGGIAGWLQAVYMFSDMAL